MCLSFEAQKHHALVQFQSSNLIQKVVALVDMNQFLIAQFKKEFAKEVEKRREGHLKHLSAREKGCCVIVFTKGCFRIEKKTTKKL